MEDVMGLIVLSSMAAIIGVIALMWAIATEFENLAADKGYKDKKYFWWTFWLPMVGICMVLAMPNKKGVERIVGGAGSFDKAEFCEELPEL